MWVWWHNSVLQLQSDYIVSCFDEKFSEYDINHVWSSDKQVYGIDWFFLKDTSIKY